MPHPAFRPLVRSALLALALASLASCATAPTESAQSVLARASQAMGAASLRSIAFAGSGTGATFGQAYEAGKPWPRITYSSFSRLVDYENAAMREDASRSRAEPAGGGVVPPMGQGEQRTSGAVRGAHAWNIAGANANPAPVAVDARIHDLWTTPHGVIKAALANQATVAMRSEGGRSLAAVSFTVPGRFRATAMINADGLVERIESTHPNAVLGDTASVILFSNYQDFAGVRFPLRIQQDLGGHPVLDLTVHEVKPNAPAGIETPAAVPAAVERVVATKVTDGVWMLGGGSHNSVAIEMRDHLMVVESPLYDGRALPMLAEAARLVPGKPVTMVVNSHHHFDHAGGLRAAAAQGATLVVSARARPFYQQALGNPNRVSPDALEKSGRKAVFAEVDGRRVFSDGMRTVEVYAIEGNLHAQGFLMVYLPKEKILIEADAYTPAAPNTPPPARPNELSVNLVQNIERLKLQVDTIVPLHGRVVPVAELHNAIGRR